jgi:hypothetical protein
MLSSRLEERNVPLERRIVFALNIAAKCMRIEMEIQ